MFVFASHIATVIVRALQGSGEVLVRHVQYYIWTKMLLQVPANSLIIFWCLTFTVPYYYHMIVHYKLHTMTQPHGFVLQPSPCLGEFRDDPNRFQYIDWIPPISCGIRRFIQTACGVFRTFLISANNSTVITNSRVSFPQDCNTSKAAPDVFCLPCAGRRMYLQAVRKEPESNDGNIHDNISDCGLSSVVHQWQ